MQQPHWRKIWFVKFNRKQSNISKTAKFDHLSSNAFLIYIIFPPIFIPSCSSPFSNSLQNQGFQLIFSSQSIAQGESSNQRLHLRKSSHVFPLSLSILCSLPISLCSVLRSLYLCLLSVFYLSHMWISSLLLILFFV